MWFGNLVTMCWWDDLWLNEAFAEWFAHKAVDAHEPSYLIWSDFQNDKNRALADDALPTRIRSGRRSLRRHRRSRCSM